MAQPPVHKFSPDGKPTHGNAYVLSESALRRLRQARADGHSWSELERRFGMSAVALRRLLER